MYMSEFSLLQSTIPMYMWMNLRLLIQADEWLQVWVCDYMTNHKLMCMYVHVYRWCWLHTCCSRLDCRSGIAVGTIIICGSLHITRCRATESFFSNSKQKFLWITLLSNVSFTMRSWRVLTNVPEDWRLWWGRRHFLKTEQCEGWH